MTNLKPCYTNPLASAESKLASKPGLSKYKHNTQGVASGSPINTTCINANERFRLQAQSLQISIANSLMCVFLTEVSLKCFRMSELKRTHCMGIYTQHSKSGRRIRNTDRKIIFRSDCHRRNHRDLEA
uniref:Uncharacterized protein n=1 Tax=Helianthus annuus TaxID=4232 RepID=A0A251TEN6_HELAN